MFKYYSCFKAKGLDTNQKLKEKKSLISIKVYRDLICSLISDLNN